MLLLMSEMLAKQRVWFKFGMPLNFSSFELLAYLSSCQDMNEMNTYTPLDWHGLKSRFKQTKQKVTHGWDDKTKLNGGTPGHAMQSVR